MVESVAAHPDFQSTSTWTMNFLAAGVEEITAETGQTIGAVTSLAVTSVSYSNQSVTYVPGTPYTFDVSYQTQDKSISVIEKSGSLITPDLSCSVSGTTPISHSIANYMASTAPSWVSINPSTGALSITAPEVNSDTEYKFFINSAVSGITNPVQKLIKLTVTNCSAANCQKCISTSSSS